MHRHISAICLGLTLLLLVGFSGPAAAKDQVPFNGRLDGTVTVTPAPPAVQVFIEATGNAKFDMAARTTTGSFSGTISR